MDEQPGYAFPIGYEELVAAVAREGAALADALRTTPADAPVPSCPGWTLRDLADHAGQFCGFWSHVLCDGAGLAKAPVPEVPAGGAAGQAWTEGADWFSDRLDDLSASLQATPASTGIWTWIAEDSSAHFAANRAAHELAVHRYDAQLAAGRAQPIEASLASAGIDEVFLMLPNRAQVREAEPRPDDDPLTGATLHLHATDVAGEWTLTLLPVGIEVARIHGKADCAIKGAASDLELLLYQRPLLGAVERFGDEVVLAGFYGAFTF